MAEILKKIIDNLNDNNLEKAYELCNKSSDKKIEHIICNIRGVISFKRQKLETAKSEFLKSIELNKNFIDAYKNLFKLNLKIQDFKFAVKNAEKVLELDIQKTSKSYFNLALAHDLDKDYKKAIKIYEVVETLDFKEKKILFNNMGKCFWGAENINEAKRYYLKALKLDQNDKLIVNNLLIIYLRTEDKDKIEQFYKKAEEIDKNYIEFKLNQSDYFLFKDETEKAINLLKSIIVDSKNYVAYTKLARIYSMIDNYDNAVETIEEAINIFPNKKDLKFTRGILHLIKGEFEKGWEFYELRDSILKDLSFEKIKKWKGENLKDSRVLVTSEQGMGDVIQFSRFLISLSPLCKEIDFITYDKLLPIFKNQFRNINISNKKKILKKKYDFQISIGSLNKYFYKDKNSNSSDLINFSVDKKKKWNFSQKDEKKKYWFGMVG